MKSESSKGMTKARLAIILSRLPAFEGAKEGLEQYPTDSEVAAGVLWEAAMKGDVQGKRVVDLGSGPGVLGLGCLLLGAGHAVFVEKDAHALEQAKNSFSKMESEGLFTNREGETGIGERAGERGKEKGRLADFVQGEMAIYKGAADVVVMNPPFGTRKAHAVREFLEKAMQIAPLIYSFHKSETLPFLRGFAARKGFLITHEWLFDFPLKASMAHHRRRIHRIAACCIRLEKQQGI